MRDRLIANLPRYAPFASRLAPILNASGRSGIVAKLGKRLMGFSEKRHPPAWHRQPFNPDEVPHDTRDRTVALFVDTFSTHFEPENARAAVRVLRHGGWNVVIPQSSDGERLCCGRTFLNAGMIDEARIEAKRVIDTFSRFIERGIAVVGLEPSCLLTFRDEFIALHPGARAQALGDSSLLLEEFLVRERRAGRWSASIDRAPTRSVLVHGHCHQKAFGAMEAVGQVLAWIPGLDVQPIESSCCGMAGSFGYEAEHYEASMAMGNLNLFPAIRDASDDAWVVTDGTSCRQQIKDGTGREAVHVAAVLDAALGAAVS